MQQGMEQPQGGMVGNVFVGASPLQHMAQLLKQSRGGQGVMAADEQQMALGQRQQQAYRGTLQAFANAKTREEKIAALLLNPQTAPQGIAMQAKDDEAYDMRPGAKRMRGNQVIADNPVPETFGTTPHVGTGGPFVMSNQGNIKALPEGVTPRPEVKLAGNGMAYDPFNTKPGQVFNDPNHPFALTGAGQPVANQAVQDYQMRKAKAGATTVPVNVSMDRGFGGDLSKIIGENVGNQSTQARAAANTIATIQQVQSALSSGNVNIGPTGDVRQVLDRIGVTLGVAGKDANERLANTGTLIQGLAQGELSAAEQMKGQGAITDAERSLIKKASLGAQNLTAPELVAASAAIDKVARAKIRLNSENIKKLRANPQFKEAGAIDFMSVDEPAPIQWPSGGTQAPLSGADAVEAALAKHRQK